MQNRTSRTGHSKQDWQSKTERTERQNKAAGQDCQDWIVKTGLPGQDYQDMTARTGLPRHNSRDRTAGTGQPGQDARYRTVRTGLHCRIARTGLPRGFGLLNRAYSVMRQREEKFARFFSRSAVSLFTRSFLFALRRSFFGLRAREREKSTGAYLC
jgi:hypothetical protein